MMEEKQLLVFPDQIGGIRNEEGIAQLMSCLVEEIHLYISSSEHLSVPN
jgi:hypothetical protein